MHSKAAFSKAMFISSSRGLKFSDGMLMSVVRRGLCDSSRTGPRRPPSYFLQHFTYRYSLEAHLPRAVGAAPDAEIERVCRFNTRRVVSDDKARTAQRNASGSKRTSRLALIERMWKRKQGRFVTETTIQRNSKRAVAALLGTATANGANNLRNCVRALLAKDSGSTFRVEPANANGSSLRIISAKVAPSLKCGQEHERRRWAIRPRAKSTRSQKPYWARSLRPGRNVFRVTQP